MARLAPSNPRPLSILTIRCNFRSVHGLPLCLPHEGMHGHQYFVEVSAQLAAEHAKDVEYRRLRVHLESEIKSRVVDVLDGQDLSRVLDGRASTGENLVEWIHTQLEKAPGLQGCLVGVALQETRKNRFISAHTIPEMI